MCNCAASVSRLSGFGQLGELPVFVREVEGHRRLDRDLPFAEGGYDAVTAVLSLHHLLQAARPARKRPKCGTVKATNPRSVA